MAWGCMPLRAARNSSDVRAAANAASMAGEARMQARRWLGAKYVRTSIRSSTGSPPNRSPHLTVPPIELADVGPRRVTRRICSAIKKKKKISKA